MLLLNFPLSFILVFSLKKMDKFATLSGNLAIFSDVIDYSQIPYDSSYNLNQIAGELHSIQLLLLFILLVLCINLGMRIYSSYSRFGP